MGAKTKEDALDLVKIIVKALDEKKSEDIKTLDISNVSVMADYFIIASGSNVNQVHAMADFVEEKLAKEGIKPSHIEGYRNANWILMDFGDLIVHIFDDESRSFYDLERIWKGGKVINI